MSKITSSQITGKPLSEKVVVITGGSSGVGRAAAIEFAAAGATVVVAARSERALQEVVEECSALRGKAVAVVADMTDAEAVRRLAAKAAELKGRIDVWVNNAGVLAAGSLTGTPVEVHDRVIQTNLIGYLHGAAAVMPIFKKQGYGVLINNISVGGWVATPYAVGYTASKFGLRGFSEALRTELTSWPDIHVCDLFPAFLDTPGIQHAANYTGVELKPAPPVFNPARVAKAMVRLSRFPRSATTTDFAAPLLKMANGLFPGLFRKIAARVTEGYLRRAEPINSTTGNVFDPVSYGTSIYGGWNSRPPNVRANAKRALILTCIAIALAGIAVKRR